MRKNISRTRHERLPPACFFACFQEGEVSTMQILKILETEPIRHVIGKYDANNCVSVRRFRYKRESDIAFHT